MPRDALVTTVTLIWLRAESKAGWANWRLNPVFWVLSPLTKTRTAREEVCWGMVWEEGSWMLST